MPPPPTAGPGRLASLLIGFCTVTANCLDRLRVVPRLLVGGYGWLIYEVARWYMTLPDPNTQQAALITILVGVAAPVFGFYMQGGVTANGKK